MNTNALTREGPPTPIRKARSNDPAARQSPDGDRPSRIQWMTKRQIQEVSIQLASIRHSAMRSEAKGDYFKSGDLAYEIQEIIRATATLFIKSRRAKD